MIWMLNELIQANKMFYMNFSCIEQYGGDDIDINHTSQVFAHHSCVIPFPFVRPYPLMTKCSYSEVVEDTEY